MVGKVAPFYHGICDYKKSLLEARQNLAKYNHLLLRLCAYMQMYPNESIEIFLLSFPSLLMSLSVCRSP